MARLNAFVLACLGLGGVATAAPLITTQPSPVSVVAGEHATLSVSASGGAMNYQWFRGTAPDTSSPVPGADGPLLVSLPLRQETRYWVRITDATGSTDSDTATAEIVAPVAGVLKGMGSNYRGQLGGKATLIRPAPVAVADGVVQSSIRDEHSLFVKIDGSLWSVGANYSGQLGDTTQTSRITPVQVATTVVQAAAGGVHSVFLKSDGTAWSMGYNSAGQLGRSTSASIFSTPGQVTDNVVAVAAGSEHSYFLKADGTLWAAGGNGYGQLGNGTTTKASLPVQIATGVAAIRAGDYHGLFIKANGTLWGTGSNTDYQLGDGSPVNRTSPVQIASDVCDAEGGLNHSVFRRTDGSWWAMGHGLLGDGDSGSRPFPVALPAGIRRIAAGGAFSLWMMNSGKLSVAGENGNGQLGEAVSPVIVAAETPHQAVRVSAGFNGTLFIDATPVIAVQPASQGVLNGGSVELSVESTGNGPFAYQWFRGQSGSTIDPVAGAQSPELTVPAPPAEARYWVRVSNSHGFTDSATAVVELATAPVVSGGLEPRGIAWGEGAAVTVQASGGALSYQWFAGASGDTSAPVAGATGALLLTPPLYAPASYWVRVSNVAGSLDSPAVTVTSGPSQAGSLRGFGYNAAGQLGTGDSTLRSSPWSIDAPVIAIAAGFDETRYLRPDFVVWETRTHSSSPKRSLEISAVKMTCGSSHELYLQTDGSLWAKGDNSLGQLGDGTFTNRTTPVQVATGVADVEAGSFYTLILKTDGTLWACGENDYGQLGDGTFETRATPVLITAGVRAIAAGNECSHFIKTDGTLWSMGDNSKGQLGKGVPGSERRPVQIATGVARVATATNHSLFVKTDGSLWGMGSNFSGQVGPGNSSIDAPQLIASSVTGCAAGNSFSLYQTIDGTLWGLGSNAYGQFGIGTTSSGSSTPVAIASGVKSFAAGNYHTLLVDFKPGITAEPIAAMVAVNTSATLSVTAHSPAGALGYQWFVGLAGDTSQPVSGGTGATLVTPALTANTNFWVRVTNDEGSVDSRAVLVTIVTPPVITTQPPPSATIDPGDSVVMTVAASGLGLSYQWFIGEAGNVSSPVTGATGALLVSPPLTTGGPIWVRVTNVAGSVDSAVSTVALTADYPGSLRTVGANASGQLGNGTTTQATTPFEIANSVQSIAAGLAHSLYIATDGTLWATGSNTSGQLGDGSQINRTTPATVATHVVRVSAGGEHTLFLKRDGSLWGMGRNHRGQLGVISPVMMEDPVLVATGVAQVAAGGNHSLYIKTDGSLWTMGEGGAGQLGNGSFFVTSPTLVANGVASVAAGTSHSLFVKTDGTLWAMGLNSSGQLGDNSTTNRSTPLQVATGVAKVAAGSNFSLHLTTAGVVFGTGASSYGQLGPAGTTRTWTSITNATRAIAAGAEHTLILKTTGALQVTGRNQFGQLGTGNLTNRSSLQQVSTGVTRIAAGGTHSMYLRARPVILSQPLEIGATAGQTPTLAVTATGYPTLAYQWYAGTSGVTLQPIAGATAASFTTPAFTADADYWVRVTGPGGSGDSRTIAVKAVTAPSVAVPPSAVKIPQGRSAGLEVSATGGVLSYQWFTGLPGDTSSPVAGGTTAKLETPPLTATTSFWVRISNAAGTVDSTAATVTTIPAVLAGLGWNAVGQLGDGTVTDVLLPQPIAAGVIAVSGGHSHSMLLKSDGTLWAAGDNGFGSLGDGTVTDRPTFIQIASDVVKIDGGYLYSLFLKADGTLWGAGRNTFGALGIPDNDRIYTPIQIASGVTDFAAGSYHSLFVKNDGTLWASGDNFWGQLGDGTNIDKESPVQIATGVAKVAAGSSHSHFIKTDGTLWGMGYNSSGRLGDGTSDRRQTPVPIATGVAAVSDGDVHSLFVKTDGTLWAMGYNGSGRLGDGSTISRSTPVQIASGIRHASAGSDHSLFVKDDNTLWAAGFNRNGQLGDGTQTTRLTPVKVATGVTAAEAADNFSLFFKADGSAWAMGANTSSQFGDDLDFLHDQPLEFDGPVSSFAAGGSHTLFVKPDGTLWATGFNSSGQLGDGSNWNRFEPVQVATGVRQVAAGDAHSLFLKSDGVLWAVGSNSDGQLGDGTTTSRTTPVAIASDVREVAAGYYQSAYITNDGKLWRMGRDLLSYWGEAVTTPTWIASDVSRVACGERHLLFLKANGTLWVVGQNDSGQLGHGSSQSVSTPVIIQAGVIDVAAGREHSLFVREDGILWAMGSNISHQLGVQTDPDWMNPVPIQVTSGVSRAWGAGSHSVFLKSDGTLWGMGYGANGALGDARDFTEWVPAKIASGVVDARAGGGHTLFLAIGPVISSQPESVTVAPGTAAPFSVTAFGPGPLAYQWFRGVSGDTSQPVADSDDSTFSPPAANVPQNYWVRVSNEHANADSRTVVMAIDGSGDPDYQSWAAARGLSDLSGTGDPDQDGSVNLIEYAFNTDPLNSTAGQLPTGAVMEDWNGPAMTITFRHVKHAAVNYRIERSIDLGSWVAIDDEIGYYMIDPDVDGDGTTELRRAFVPIQPGETQGFLRLSITPK